MEGQSSLPYPFEFSPIDPEEQAEISRLSHGNEYKCCRVGPNGYTAFEQFKLDAANIYHMPLRSSDIFVAAYQRSGTTWTQELVWLVANDLDYAKAAEVPVHLRYPFLDHYMNYDGNQADRYIKVLRENGTTLPEEKLRETYKSMCAPVTSEVATMPSPRFFKTHLPLSLLNPKLLDTAKMVYVARDPRDVAVSCFHHARLLNILRCPGGFKDFWNIFRKNIYSMLPIFEHVKEAWNQRHHPNMLFLFYEELSMDRPTAVRRVADFLGKKLSDEQIDELCKHLSFEKIRNNSSVNYDDFKDSGLFPKGESFMRKGKVGGWREYFDDEMTRQADKWIQDNLKDTDLRFPTI